MKKGKKVLSVLLAVVLLLGCLPVTASAESVSYPVSGGSITFDLSSGTVTGVDTSITKLEIPSEIHGVKVETFDVSTGDLTNLISISFPDSVTEINFYASNFVQNLTEINVDENNPEFSSQDGVLFNKKKTRLLVCPPGKSGTYSIPNGVTSIEDFAFYQCSKISTLVIPKSFTSIEDYAFAGEYESDRYGAYYGLSGLKNVVLPNTVTKIGAHAFYRCALKEVTIPKSVTSIGEYAFSGCGLKTVVISEGVKSIGDCAFLGCSNLTDVWLPLSLQTVGSSAFSGTNLKKVYYINGDKERWEKIVFANGNGDLLSAALSFTEDDDTVEDDDYLTIPYELRTDTGEVILTMRFPESWGNVSVDFSKDPSSNLFWFNWTFSDSNQAQLFAIGLNYGGWDGPGIEVIGDVTLYPEKPSYSLLYEETFSPPYTASDNSAAAVAYREMKKDIPKILRSIEPNPELDWNWLLSDSGFTDVPQSAYYYDAVKWAVNENVTSGTNITRFSPDQSCTRAQAVTFLWRAAGEPEPAGGNTGFTDVKEGEYYERAVRWAVENGITAGTSETKFSPNAKCTRAQIVTFLWRSAGEPDTGGSNAFWDVSSGDYYADAVTWAVRNNITAGTSATAFSPNSRCTRAQIVTFLYRSR